MMYGGMMMAICPLCNALDAQTYSCPTCASLLQDYGKIVDYLDTYSAYLDQDLLLQVDGLTQNNSQQHCVHVFYCAACNTETDITVKLV